MTILRPVLTDEAVEAVVGALFHRSPYLNADQNDANREQWADLARRILDSAGPIIKRQVAEEIAQRCLAIGSHAGGHRCTCTLLTPQTPIKPAEWEQDPWCPTHPDMSYITSERDKLRACLEQIEGLNRTLVAEKVDAQAEVERLRTRLAAAERVVETARHVLPGRGNRGAGPRKEGD